MQRSWIVLVCLICPSLNQSSRVMLLTIVFLDFFMNHCSTSGLSEHWNLLLSQDSLSLAWTLCWRAASSRRAHSASWRSWQLRISRLCLTVRVWRADWSWCLSAVDRAASWWPWPCGGGWDSPRWSTCFAFAQGSCGPIEVAGRLWALFHQFQGMKSRLKPFYAGSWWFWRRKAGSDGSLSVFVIQMLTLVSHRA